MLLYLSRSAAQTSLTRVGAGALLGLLLEDPTWLTELSLVRKHPVATADATGGAGGDGGGDANSDGDGGGVQDLFGPDVLRLLPLSPAGLLDGTYRVDDINLRVRHVQVSFVVDGQMSPPCTPQQ